MDNCPICDFQLKQQKRTINQDGDAFDCARCGVYILSNSAQCDIAYYLKTERKRMALSYAIRRAQRKQPPAYTTAIIEKIIYQEYLPSIREQVDNLIRWIGENGEEPGASVRINFQEHGAIIGIQSIAGFIYIVSYCLNAKILEGDFHAHAPPNRSTYLRGGATVLLSFSGWDRFDQIQKGLSSGQNAFMAMKFGDSQLDEIIDTYFRGAVKLTGFELKRLDDNPKAGLIDDRMRLEIKSCRFLIADLTHANNGAYWEAGYAEGLGKPVIYTCRKDVFENSETRPHFDTNHHLTVSWDPQNIAPSIQLLKNTIRATLPEAKQTDEIIDK